MKTEIKDYIPFYGYNSYIKRLYNQGRATTIEEERTAYYLFVYHLVSSVVILIIICKFLGI